MGHIPMIRSASTSQPPTNGSCDFLIFIADLISGLPAGLVALESHPNITEWFPDPFLQMNRVVPWLSALMRSNEGKNTGIPLQKKYVWYGRYDIAWCVQVPDTPQLTPALQRLCVLPTANLINAFKNRGFFRHSLSSVLYPASEEVLSLLKGAHLTQFECIQVPIIIRSVSACLWSIWFSSWLYNRHLVT